MKKGYWIAILSALLLLFVVLVSIWYMKSHSIAVLDPKGMIAEKQSELITTASLLMLIIVIPVFILMGFFAWRYRANNKKAKHAPDWEHNYIAEYCWWGVPLIIIVVLAILTWRSSHQLNPFKPIESDKAPLKIQVIALQWKWLFIYPEQGIATLSYVQFPEKRPIAFEITADAPMNSFWIPQLGGQIYAMPAMRTKLHLIANEVGKFRGASANISGTGFASMTFIAQACSEESFAEWVEQVKAKGKPLGADEYELLARPSQKDPVTLYVLEQGDLFDSVVMKYMQ
jgi:cytochrome o ubiquinol oxidase subunit II